MLARTILVACTAAVATPASAFVVTTTPILPVLGVGYASPVGIGCFPVAGVCVEPGTLTLTALVASSFDAAGQDIVTEATYAGVLTNLASVVLGPITLTGTIAQRVHGRTSPGELGSWATELVALSLGGTVLGTALSMTLDPAIGSVGSTTIATHGDVSQGLYRVDSFFDVFVELTLDLPTPLRTTRGPISVTLVPVPEPATIGMLGVALAGMLGGRRRRRWPSVA